MEANRGEREGHVERFRVEVRRRGGRQVAHLFVGVEFVIEAHPDHRLAPVQGGPKAGDAAGGQDREFCRRDGPADGPVGREVARVHVGGLVVVLLVEGPHTALAGGLRDA